MDYLLENDVPIRSYMEDSNISWRHKIPDYTLVNKKYLKEKCKKHQEGSLEKLVENLVKTWEMESTHKFELKVGDK